jgi:hypothetical protein
MFAQAVQRPVSGQNSFIVDENDGPLEIVSPESVTLTDFVWLKAGSDVTIRIGETDDGSNGNGDDGNDDGSDGGSGGGSSGGSGGGGSGSDGGTDQTPVATLIFLFDNAGNQIVRKPESDKGSEEAAKVKDSVYTISLEEDLAHLDEPTEKQLLDRSIVVYPNPTKGNLIMAWDWKYNGLIKSILVSDMSNRRIPVEHTQNTSDARVDLTRYPTGLYLVSFKLTDGTTIEKKIIKN